MHTCGVPALSHSPAKVVAEHFMGRPKHTRQKTQDTMWVLCGATLRVAVGPSGGVQGGAGRGHHAAHGVRRLRGWEGQLGRTELN